MVVVRMEAGLRTESPSYSPLKATDATEQGMTATMVISWRISVGIGIKRMIAQTRAGTRMSLIRIGGA